MVWEGRGFAKQQTIKYLYEFMCFKKKGRTQEKMYKFIIREQKWNTEEAQWKIKIKIKYLLYIPLFFFVCVVIITQKSEIEKRMKN